MQSKFWVAFFAFFINFAFLFLTVLDERRILIITNIYCEVNMKKQYIVKDPSGLHARPAVLLSTIAYKYDGDVFIIYQNSRYTLKSILTVMSLSIPEKAKFEIEVIGQDAEKLIDRITFSLEKEGII